jgi:(1->4)-alpha-D-glucan 1-alpha-D-glucosylmutase
MMSRVHEHPPARRLRYNIHSALELPDLAMEASMSSATVPNSLLPDRAAVSPALSAAADGVVDLERQGTLEMTAQELQRRRYLPESTYRLQLHRGFRFLDAAAIVSYLHDLGITTCYASPYLKSRPGSTHGYDISDHRLLNPEIGSDEEHTAWVQTLHEHHMGLILDVVPNHMGIAGGDNPWWNDVLENGQASPNASFFDIDWHSSKPDLDGKVLLPILGDPYGKVLEARQLQLRYEGGAFQIHYFDHHIPIAPCTYGAILEDHAEEVEQELGAGSEGASEFQSIRTAIAHLPPHTSTDPAKVAERRREKEVIKRRLATLAASYPPVRAFIERTVERLNGGSSTTDPHSLDPLDRLLDAQPYRLAWWRVAADEINYRRFFDINELAALSMERPEVFAATHERILQMLCSGQIQGLRIDHPDGLFNPEQYLRRLQAHYAYRIARSLRGASHNGATTSEQEDPALLEAIRAAACRDPENAFFRPLYVVVEKILGLDEPLPETWPVSGTTGYEFLTAVNNLLVDHNNAAAFTRLYRKFTEMDIFFRDLVYRKKYLILQVALSSELQMLALQLDRLSEKNRWSRDFTLASLRRALREIISCFDVYRSYITGVDVSPRDRRVVERAVAEAKRRNPAISAALFDFVKEMLLPPGETHIQNQSADARQEQLRFVGKFQQVTAPVMAKGVEDTAFYIYNRLIGLNEVGGDPQQFGLSVAAFHRRNLARQAHFPYGLSATATHDTKRGEEMRARLAVLSELPHLWHLAVNRWTRLNKRHKVQRGEELLPNRNEEYFLYQTLLGAWPLGEVSADEMQKFRQRMSAYMQKAMREAKVHTSWINPNPAFDAAVEQFLQALLDEEKSKRFLADFRSFQARLDHYALFNGLSQALLKVASPGAADVYQGTELWDFHLVDPDNRQPVDFLLRRRLLDDLQVKIAAGPEALPALCRELILHRQDGRVKLYLLMRALRCRRDHPGLFAEGEYLPATVSSGYDDNICAFVRRHEGQIALAVAPRLLTRVIAPGDLPLGAEAWEEGLLRLPEGIAAPRWRDICSGQVVDAANRDGQLSFRLADLLAHFPTALLLAEGPS